MKRFLRDLLRSTGFSARWVLAAEYLRLVWLTNRFSYDPADVYDIVEPEMPAIFAFWHGQHFMTPFIKTKESHRAKVLISRHRDGEFNAIAAERLGIGTIEGLRRSWRRVSPQGRRRCVQGNAARAGRQVERRDHRRRAEARAGRGAGHHHAGAGVGRPIMPFAMVTSRFIRLKNWDLTINLPFGRGAVVGIEPVHVPPDADAETMEKLRLQVEALLNEATRRACGGRASGGRSWLIRCR